MNERKRTLINPLVFTYLGGGSGSEGRRTVVTNTKEFTKRSDDHVYVSAVEYTVHENGFFSWVLFFFLHLCRQLCIVYMY